MTLLRSSLTGLALLTASYAQAQERTAPPPLSEKAPDLSHPDTQIRQGNEVKYYKKDAVDKLQEAYQECNVAYSLNCFTLQNPPPAPVLPGPNCKSLPGGEYEGKNVLYWAPQWVVPRDALAEVEGDPRKVLEKNGKRETCIGVTKDVKVEYRGQPTSLEQVAKTYRNPETQPDFYEIPFGEFVFKGTPGHDNVLDNDNAHNDLPKDGEQLALKVVVPKTQPNDGAQFSITEDGYFSISLPNQNGTPIPSGTTFIRYYGAYDGFAYSQLEKAVFTVGPKPVEPLAAQPAQAPVEEGRIYHFLGDIEAQPLRINDTRIFTLAQRVGAGVGDPDNGLYGGLGFRLVQNFGDLKTTGETIRKGPVQDELDPNTVYFEDRTFSNTPGTLDINPHLYLGAAAEPTLYGWDLGGRLELEAGANWYNKRIGVEQTVTPEENGQVRDATTITGSDLKARERYLQWNAYADGTMRIADLNGIHALTQFEAGDNGRGFGARLGVGPRFELLYDLDISVTVNAVTNGDRFGWGINGSIGTDYTWGGQR